MTGTDGNGNGRSKSWDALPDGIKKGENAQIGAATSNDWMMEKGMPTLFACWAFFDGILWMVGLLEFEQAVIYILFAMVVLQLFAINRSDTA